MALDGNVRRIIWERLSRDKRAFREMGPESAGNAAFAAPAGLPKKNTEVTRPALYAGSVTSVFAFSDDAQAALAASVR